MKALIFAAGLGQRMRPLTDTTPKPLLRVGGKALIVWHLEKLAALGISDVVINTAWLAEQFPRTLGDGAHWGLRLHYVHEGDTPLETGGGMLNALPLLGEAPFLLVNGDVWTDYDFARLPRSPQGLAHLVLTSPPAHAPDGDFALTPDGLVQPEGSPRLTYTGIGIYRPQLLDNWPAIVPTPDWVNGRPRFALAPILRAHMRRQTITGECHAGRWTDVGTPQRLAALDAELASQSAPST